MGFIKPSMPDLDYEAWAQRPRMERVKPMAQEWAQSGFGTPDAVLVLYVVKIALYVAGAAAITSWTTDVGGLGDISAWWSEPVFFQKVVVFTLLFEVLGFGCGFGPLTLRFLPPIGAFLYWLRPGTIRLPAWPNQVPGTAGTRRTAFDVALYLGVIASAVWILLAPAQGDPVAGAELGMIDPARLVPLLVLLPLMGLRDKTIFLAARAEVYGTFVLTFLLTGIDVIVAAQLVMVAIWWGAAFSKLNLHFPYVVSVMMSNSPVLRLKAIKRRFHRSYPDDIRPSKVSAALAHGGTVIEFSVPLVLLLSNGGIVTTVAAIIMIAFHLHILTSLPMGVPLEWNVFMIFGIGVLFVDFSEVGPTSADNPLPIVAGMAALVALILAGNLHPTKFSFLPAMRYYAGNWATSMWSLTPGAIEKFDASVTKAARLPHQQLDSVYGPELSFPLMHKGMAFRAMHTHGRALFALAAKAAGPSHETDYIVADGEFVAGVAIGWNFGDGHLHDEQLLAALQERCQFEPGEVRVVMLESQPLGKPWQEYRLVDAATGEFERGRVLVRDMLIGQPWDTDIPVQVLSSTATTS